MISFWLIPLSTPVSFSCTVPLKLTLWWPRAPQWLCNYLFFVFSGQEVTYRGHAGLGRPVPSPFLLGPPPGHYAREEDQILPRKVRGTPTLYADLLFPSSSNFGSMKRRPAGRRDPAAAGAGGGQVEAGNVILRSREGASHLSPTNRERETDYVRIRFNPNLAERVELWPMCMHTVLVNIIIGTCWHQY
jgi:hypothetical protein